jgi:hypothetical protein
MASDPGSEHKTDHEQGEVQRPDSLTQQHHDQLLLVEALLARLASIPTSDDPRHDLEHIIMYVYYFLLKVDVKHSLPPHVVRRLLQLFLAFDRVDKGRRDPIFEPSSSVPGNIPTTTSVFVRDMLDSVRLYCRNVLGMSSDTKAATWIASELKKLGCKGMGQKAIANKFRGQVKHTLLEQIPIRDERHVRAVLATVASLLQ